MTRAPHVNRDAPLDNPRGGRREYQIIAGAVSVGLHLLLVLVFLGSHPGGVLASGGETVEPVEPYFEVSLAGLAHDDPEGAQAAQAAEMQELLKQLRQIQTDAAIPVPPPTRQQSLDDLFKAVETERADRARGQSPPSGRSDQDAGGRGADPAAPDRASKPRPGPTSQAARNPTPSSAGAGDLWGFLEPCWKKLPGRSLVPVTLEVTLNAQGTISVPPRIVRPDGAPITDARLISEARALAALGACLPYKGKGLGAATFERVDFSSS